jgi:glycosyltransferase involved in cell wall biosynthesis
MKKIINQIIASTILYSSFVVEFFLLRILRIIHKNKYQFSDSKDFGNVTIILPTFNRSNILFSRSIPSIINQTYKNWELLVVSHGCTDATEEQVLELSKTDQRIKLIRINRRKLGYPPSAENHWLVGPVKPINAGLRAASGLWIARIDDDDEWESNHLGLLLSIVANSEHEFISSAYNEVSPKTFRTINPSGTPPIGGVQTWVYRSYLVLFRSHISSWRKKWNRVNDTDVQERMIKAGVRTTITNKVTVVIRSRPGEEEIGSKAYLKNANKYEGLYKID